MTPEHKRILHLAVPYLRRGIRKDFVLHTKMVLRAMTLLLKKENGDRDILIPAAILHDVGWADVPLSLQKSRNKREVRRAMELHLELSVPIIKGILSMVDIGGRTAGKIIEVVLAHKFCNPKLLNKKLLIDADTLSDLFKEQFYSDARAFNVDPAEFFQIRKQNRFYTETARQIFLREAKTRAKELAAEDTTLSPTRRI